MTQPASFCRIGIDAARELLSRPDLLLLDMRDANSYQYSHIASALHVTSGNIDGFLLRTPKTKPVLIYCYHGIASQVYAQTFIDFGFKEIYSLDGGFEGWRLAEAEAAGAAPVLSDGLQSWLAEQGFPAGNIDALIANRTTPLMKASHLGDTAVIEELLQAGAQLEARNADGNTALWLACVSQSLEVIDLLARAGISLDNQNDNGATCLMYAASSGKPAVVEKLLALGADPRLQSLDGFTALDMAATIECLNLLRAAEKRARRAA
jgi:rhodanese-related sulfurtransferase